MSVPEGTKPTFFRELIRPEAEPLLTKIRGFISEQGIKAYLVGGFIRDTLLNRDTADIDIAVDADGLDIAQRLADTLSGKYVPLDDVNRVARVILPTAASEIDVSKLRGNIEQDLAERDFTVDAMAIDIDNVETQPEVKQRLTRKVLRPDDLIDPFNGWEDLQNKIVRTVKESSIKSDPVRLLRAFRLAFELGFKIEPDTESQIMLRSGLISSVAGERVREEFIRLLKGSGIGELLPYMDKVGLLTALIPELDESKGVEQPKEHHWNVFEHSLKTVAALEFLLRQGSWEYLDKKVLVKAPWSERVKHHFEEEVSQGSTRASLLKLSALLHDISKPGTKAFDETGRMRFLGHAIEGATAAGKILERLRFSNKEIDTVRTTIENHMRPGQMSHEGALPTRRALYRYFRDTGDTGIDILYLSLADHLAARGPDLHLDSWQEHAKMVHYVLTRYFEEGSAVVPSKLIDGNDLINTFGLKPGPEIRDLLEAVREAQAAGEVTTREEALSYIRSRLPTSPPV